MRGKRGQVLTEPLKTRITPAHAGKTDNIIFLDEITKDHPRACGENGLDDGVARGVKGSPPRMRGKPTALGFRRARRGITPAHAGKTSQS